MRIIFAIIAMASLGHAQTLGEMSKPLPWRMAHHFALRDGASSTWTGRESLEISRLVDAVETGGAGFISLRPELRADALQILRDARRNGLSSAQGMEMAAKLVWGVACAGWKDVSASTGDYLDGEDLVTMGRLIGPPAAVRWGQTKRQFALAIERWHGDQR